MISKDRIRVIIRWCEKQEKSHGPSMREISDMAYLALDRLDSLDA